MMEKWELWDYYDVYGNENDGWEVNNKYKVSSGITIADDANNDDIVNYLKLVRQLRETAKTDDFYILWECDFIEIFEKETGLPLFCFVKEYEQEGKAV